MLAKPATHQQNIKIQFFSLDFIKIFGLEIRWIEWCKQDTIFRNKISGLNLRPNKLPKQNSHGLQCLPL